MTTLKRDSSTGDNHESSCGIFEHFPDIVNETIDTNKFLTASRGVVKLIGKLGLCDSSNLQDQADTIDFDPNKFGKLFAPVKYDMQGNIEKLNARYVSDKEMNSTLQDMILLEIAIGDSTIATNALLWLTRGLHMIQTFFEKIVEDSKAEKTTEDLVAMLKKSYEETLEPYHGWMAKQLFGLLSRMVPSRSYMLQSLAKEVKSKENTILDVINDFTRRLKINVTTLHCFYEEYGLENRRN